MNALERLIAEFRHTQPDADMFKDPKNLASFDRPARIDVHGLDGFGHVGNWNDIQYSRQHNVQKLACWSMLNPLLTPAVRA